MTGSVLTPGVWGVVATPFRGPSAEVDHPSLARLVQHYEKIGVTGLTVLGVFGEAAQLSAAERQAVLTTVLDATSLPLVAGVTSLVGTEAVEEIHQAAAVTAGRLAAVMVQVNSPDAAALTEHLRRIHVATGVPVVVQDYPLISGIRIAAAELAAAIVGLDFVAAVKAEAPPTPPAIAALVAAGVTVPVFGGLGGLGLLDELAAGAAGAMTGFSFPEGLLACVRAFRQAGFPAARDAYLPYLPLVNFRATGGDRPGHPQALPGRTRPHRRAGRAPAGPRHAAEPARPAAAPGGRHPGGRGLRAAGRRSRALTHSGCR